MESHSPCSELLGKGRGEKGKRRKRQDGGPGMLKHVTDRGRGRVS